MRRLNAKIIMRARAVCERIKRISPLTGLDEFNSSTWRAQLLMNAGAK